MEEFSYDYNSTVVNPDFLKRDDCYNESTPDGWCPWHHDEVLCWPPSPPDTEVSLPCMTEFNGVHYDTSQNASRLCMEPGVWANYTNYTLCLEVIEDHKNHQKNIEIVATVYLVGYTISLIALLLAVCIFAFYKDLRCLRNTIHANLFCSYILLAVFWILNYAIQMKADMTLCTAIIIFLHYFQLTNFFWMFVEGFYLYMLVVETFVRENMKLMGYILIGWGLPAVVILIWSIAQIFIESERIDTTFVDFMKTPNNSDAQYSEPINNSNCDWYNWSSTSQWIFTTPSLLVLAVNFVFLVRIMIVLITKLRSSTNVETQMNRKATKALLVLIPLLGVTYVLVIWGPDQPDSHHSGTSHGNYGYYEEIRAGLLSTQGFTVALLYCFLNAEVRNAIRHHYQRWEDSRQIGRGLYKKCDFGNGSERLNGGRRKRESTTSEITTMTTVHSSRVSNGSVNGRHQLDI